MTEQVSVEKVLANTFDEHKLFLDKTVIFGEGKIRQQLFYFLGTRGNTFLGVDEALLMAQQVLTIYKKKNAYPLLLLVDVAGQKLAMRDEWLGMYAYFAHLLKCLHLLRRQKRAIFSLVYNQAIGGGFIAYGLMADKIYALPHATVAVMWLDAMAKVTKIDEAFLKKVSQTSPVFAPGVNNFKKLGGIHQVVALDNLKDVLLEAIKEPDLFEDRRAQISASLGGRKKAYHIIETIVAT